MIPRNDRRRSPVLRFTFDSRYKSFQRSCIRLQFMALIVIIAVECRKCNFGDHFQSHRRKFEHRVGAHVNLHFCLLIGLVTRILYGTMILSRPTFDYHCESILRDRQWTSLGSTYWILPGKLIGHPGDPANLVGSPTIPGMYPGQIVAV